MTTARQSGRPCRVSVVALPESTGTPVHGMYETLVLCDAVAKSQDEDDGRLFEVEVVGERAGVFPSATGLPLEVQRSVEDIERTDIVLTASMLFEDDEWVTDRHPVLVDWLARMHREGADLASACAGALLLGETGLLDGGQATTHWAFADTFRRNFPSVELRLEELLVVGGRRGELIMSGAASSWQDLTLFLVSRHAGPATARAIGSFLLYEWNARSQAPFLPFNPDMAHGDAVIEGAQRLLHADPGQDDPLGAMLRGSGLTRSTFARRFTRATGYSPGSYIQQARVEAAKRLLETSALAVEEVCWRVGYREPASFRRLFKRLTTLTPAEYRRRFAIPRGAGERPPDHSGLPPSSPGTNR